MGGRGGGGGGGGGGGVEAGSCFNSQQFQFAEASLMVVVIAN